MILRRRALLSAEVAGASTLLDGLVSYWKADDLSGNLVDAYGANDFVMSGGVTYGQAGKIDQSVQLDGSTGKGDINSALVSGTPCTFSFWVKMTDLTSGGYHRALTVTGANDRLSIYIRPTTNGGVAIAEYVTGGGSAGSAAGTTNIYDQQFHHIIGVFSSNSLREIWVDNQKEGTNTAEKIAIDLSETTLGYWDDIQFLKGFVDDVKIWNRALTLAEITEDYTNGLNGIALL